MKTKVTTLKRILAFLLAASMVMSMFSASVFAVGQDAHSFDHADVYQAHDGDEGDFDLPENEPTDEPGDDDDYAEEGYEDENYEDDGFGDSGLGNNGSSDNGLGDEGYEDDAYEDENYEDEGLGNEGYEDDAYEDEGYEDGCTACENELCTCTFCECAYNCTYICEYVCECEYECTYICEYVCECKCECGQYEEYVELDVTFTFEDEKLLINLIDLLFTDELELDDLLEELILAGVSAVDQDGEDVTHLIEIYDDGGLAELLRELLEKFNTPGDWDDYDWDYDWDWDFVDDNDYDTPNAGNDDQEDEIYDYSWIFGSSNYINEINNATQNEETEASGYGLVSGTLSGLFSWLSGALSAEVQATEAEAVEATETEVQTYESTQTEQTLPPVPAQEDGESEYSYTGTEENTPAPPAAPVGSGASGDYADEEDEFDWDDIDWDNIDLGGIEEEFPSLIAGEVTYRVVLYPYEDSFVSDPARVWVVNTQLFMPFSPPWTVTFDGNGGNILAGQDTQTTILSGVNQVIGAGRMPAPPSHPGGFIFRPGAYGWNTMANGSGTNFTATTPVTGNITVFAQWGHFVSFDSNAGDVVLNVGTDTNNPAHYLDRVVPPNSSVSATSQMAWPNDPVRPGFTFQGWWNTSAETGGTQFFATSNINQNTPLFARWHRLPPHTVTFSPGGNSVAASGHILTRQAAPGVSISNSFIWPHELNQPGVNWPRSAPNVTTRTRTHAANDTLGPLGTQPNTMFLMHWTTQPHGLGTRFAPMGTSVTDGAPHTLWATTVVNSNMTVHGDWAYTITFNANGGSGAPSSRGVRVTSTGVGTIAANGVWASANWNTSGVSAATTNLNDWGVPIRVGYTFRGWWNRQIPVDTPDSALLPTDRQLTVNCPINSSGTVWARWETTVLERHTFTFNPNGGNWAGSTVPLTRNPAIGYSINQSATGGMVPWPTRTGYVFMGWWRNPNAPGDNVWSGPQNRLDGHTQITQAEVNAGTTLLARWRPYHIVTFNANGGNLSGLLTPSAAPWPFPGNERRVAQGMNFANMHNTWGSVGGVQNPIGSPGGVNHFIFENTANGSPNTPPATWTSGGATRAGHTLIGWSTLPGGYTRPTQDFRNSVTINAPKTLYAQWAANINFNANRPVGTNPPARVVQIVEGRSFLTNNQHPNRPTAAPVWPAVANWGDIHTANWELVGWNTNALGTGTWWHPDTPVPVDPARTTAIQLYGIWTTGVMFTSGRAPSELVLAANRERPTPVPLNQPLANFPPPPQPWIVGGEVQGVFHRWQTAGGLTVTPITPIPGPLALHAIWIADMTLNPGPGAIWPDGIGSLIQGPGNTVIGEAEVGQNFGVLTLPALERPNWTFVEWNTAADGSGTPFLADTTVERTTTLFGQWSGNVTFNARGGTWPGAAPDAQPVREGLAYSSNAAIVAPTGAAAPSRPFNQFMGWYRVHPPSHPTLAGQFIIEGGSRIPFSTATSMNNGHVYYGALWLTYTFDQWLRYLVTQTTQATIDIQASATYDIPATDRYLLTPITVAAGRTVTITSGPAIAGHPTSNQIRLGHPGAAPAHVTTLNDGRHFIVNGNLTLSAAGTNSIVLQGHSGNSFGGGVQVNSTGTLTLAAGGMIRGNSVDGGGGGVRVEGGTFTMSGGTIENNFAGYSGGLPVGRHGGGVSIDSSGTFTMSAGLITGNSATHDGGGVDVNGTGATFTMTGGVIENNGLQGAVSGGGVHARGGATFTMGTAGATNHATPSVNNNAASGNGGGIGSNTGTVIMHSGTVSGNAATGNGGGVRVNTAMTGLGSFTMNGGVIRNNTAADTSGGGGGVSVANTNNNPARTIFTMAGGIIEDNQATSSNGGGGGVYLEPLTTLNLSGANAEIRANTASGVTRVSTASGVHVSANALLNMTGGQIHSHAGSGSNVGRGVYVAANGSLTMSGGQIRGNTTTLGNGGGVLVAANAGTVAITGGEIHTNTAINGGGVHTLSGITLGGTVNAAQIRNNTATNHGGGLWAGGGVTIQMQGSARVRENTASNLAQVANTAAGVHLEGAGTELNMDSINAQIRENTGGIGRGLFIGTGASADIQGEIYQNTTTGEGGGALIATGGSMEIRAGGIVSFNTAATNGGGVRVNTGATLTMSENAQVHTNRANMGGGVHTSGTFTLNNTGGDGIHANLATATGGVTASGVHVAAGTFNYTSGVIQNHIHSTAAPNVNIGRGIFVANNANLVIGNAEMFNNHTNDTPGGGAILTDGAGTFTIAGGSIEGNRTVGTDLHGGAINTGRALVLGSGVQINNNHASFTGAGGRGGAIHTTANLTINGATIDGNSSHGNGGGVAMHGAATATTFAMNSGSVSGNTVRGLHNGGGLWANNNVIVDISGTAQFNGNTSGFHGGGMSVEGSTGAFTIGNTVQITGNDTGPNGSGGGIFTTRSLVITGSVLIDDNDAAIGGGIQTSAALDITGATISNNTATSSAGGIWSTATLALTNTTVTGNTATGDGGGIWASGILTLNNATVTNNTTTTGNGGGLFRSGTIPTATTITGGSFTNNAAPTGTGGGIFIATAVAGASQADRNTHMTISSATTFSGNTSQNFSDLLTVGAGLTHFPNISWSGQNSRTPNGLVSNNNHIHLLNNWDVNWTHDFYRVNVNLTVVDYTAALPTATIGIGTPTVRLHILDAAPPTIPAAVALQRTTVGSYNVDVDSQHLPAASVLTVANLNPGWFYPPSVVVTVGGVAGAAQAMTNVTDTNNWTLPVINIAAGGDVVVTVTIRARAIQRIMTNVQNIDYGTHTFGTTPVRLGVTANTVTPRADVEFTVFDGTAAGWRLQAAASQPANTNNRLYSMLYMEDLVGPGSNISVGPGTIFNRAANQANPIHTFNWTTAGARGFEIRQGANPQAIGTHQAVITWTLAPPL